MPFYPHVVTASPVGDLHLVASEDGRSLLALLWRDIEPEAARVRFDLDQLMTADAPVFDTTRRQLQQYFDGERSEFDLPLDPIGTEFQRAVWEGLRRIPHGVTSSYGQLARNIDRPRAVRAVAAANGRNPISIIVPCHRVIGADGSLTGFAGGLDTKAWLLDHEGWTLGSDSGSPGAVSR